MNTQRQTVPLHLPHPGQVTILSSTARFRVVACGRRFGKTELAKLILAEQALRGGRRTWWLAPTYPMASQVWKDLKATMRNVCGTTISEALHQMDFPGGGSIAIRSTHAPDHLRGAGLDFAVLDEAAFMEARVWSEVVRPMLLDRQGGAIFLSTPCGRNWFYDLYRLGLNAQEPAWAAFHFTSLDNPLIAPAEFDTIRRTTPERIWRSEYLAEFVDDAGQVFRGIQEAATVPLSPVPQPGHRYVLGVDWGREQDFTCLVVIDATTQQMVALERFNKIGWQLQRGRLQALVDVWRPQVIYAEANSIGSVNIEALQAEGLAVRPFMTTARSKPPLIEALALAIERGDLALLADEVLLHELGAYALERLPGGGYRYSAPAGAHDDTVIALALAWHAAQSGGVSLDFA